MRVNMYKRLVGSLAIVIVSITLSLLLAEIILRYLFPIPVSTSYNHRIPHPDFGWVLEAGVSYLNEMPEDSVRVTYNSLGWRDVEHSLKNDSGALRVLVLGDSFMEGYTVGLDDSFHRQIEELARRDHINIEAINLGVGGYGTLQEYLVFQEVGKYYKPDIVLVGFYVDNDVKNNSLALQDFSKSYRADMRPFLGSSNEAEWEITNVDFEGAQRRFMEARKSRDTFIYKFAKQSALVQAVLRTVRRIYAIVNSADSTGIDRKSMFGGNYCKELPEYTEAWATTKRIFDRLNDEVSSTGAELFIFSVPALHEVIEDYIKDVPDRKLVCWDDAPAYSRLEGITDELGIGYVDLLPSFRAIMSDNKANLFCRSDRHWNESGHKTAASIVYSALQHRGLLPNPEIPDLHK